jgi:hypothetical protein
MDARVKWKMEMASRVLAYAREHPSDAAGYQAAVGKLVERLEASSVMAQRQTTSRLLTRGAIAERQAVRRDLTADLQLLTSVARTAGIESVGTPVVIRYPGPKANNIQFADGTRAAIQLGREQEELLLRHGLPVDHLDQLTSGLEQFVGLLGRRDEVKVARIDAGSQLKQLGRDLVRAADEIGAFNRHRYRKDPAALVAWRHARKLPKSARQAVSQAGPQVGNGALPALPPGPSDREAVN